MTPDQFAYWLQGFAEMNAGQMPNPTQWKSICEHLATVFKKVTPPVQTGPVPTPTISPALPVTYPPFIPPSQAPTWWSGPICGVGQAIAQTQPTILTC